VPRFDEEETIRLLDWQRPQQHCIENAEHNGVSPDAQRERDEGDRRKRRTLSQRPNGESDIGQHVHLRT
jgi:hypothetical protein